MNSPNEKTPAEARTRLCPLFPPSGTRSGAAIHCFADLCADWVWKQQGNQPPTVGHCGNVKI